MTDAREDLLIELGTEELPPTALHELMTRFADEITAGLDQAGVGHGAHHAYATPRRLAVTLESVATRQPDRTIERAGPAVAAAFDADGNPTKAAEGFARSCGVAVEALERMETDKGERLGYRGIEPGRETAALLPEVIDQALARLPIPKRMRWGDSDAAFVRPVHWLVVRLGDTVVPVEVLELASGGESRGHRFHHPAAIPVTAANYAERLRDPGYVIADFDARREYIREQVEAAARGIGGTAEVREDLLEEVAALVEWPVALAGSFDEAFLRVPEEALVSSMEGHQKYFPVRGGDGRLLPRFIAVANIDSRDPSAVVAGNERVIRPRLADAAFFWDQDRRTPLAERVDDLGAVVFQKALGTLYDKSARVAALARRFAPAFGADAAQAERAAWLAKTDLLTEMVDEFPELQGVMGRYYAREDGEPAPVADALDEVYQPRAAGDAVAASALGRLLAVCERADTLVGIFAVGKAPTGAKDPFGLRRAALGLVRSLLEGNHDVPLHAVFAAAADNLPGGLDGDAQVTPVIDFCLERLRAHYLDDGVPAEVFAAVRAVAGGADATAGIPDFDRRLRACQAFLARPEAASLAEANKRIRNILRKSGEADGALPAPDPARFEQAEERALDEAVAEAETVVTRQVAAGDYAAALEHLAGLNGPVNRFFEHVMVMADDEAVRRNRLALLDRLSGSFLRVADVSQLPGSA
ncbi:Glycine--tRNA ligase beta subunit [wastewater metagenome]|uniref:glycine--tRNA ligase n=2 Tax=unclassified sequences TaxID=12908 RepID=A0A5B8RCE2_9ZZZZ|nr:glycine--tRNA ligase subunit beta [Arhodomonas sp. KWT]QEA05072.1 glycine--tRNA ligase beta subunit [uncultured organism]